MKFWGARKPKTFQCDRHGSCFCVIG
ncbi:MAG: hypothetical protein IJW37_03020 [Lachnospiraceae bacterium]|nr:hypothetical protein [Lachnospiraceae bacterium]